MLETLTLVRLPIRPAVKPHLVELRDPLLFVDGPKHNDKKNALTDNFDYFCSSGGTPSTKNGRISLLLVLDSGGVTTIRLMPSPRFTELRKTSPSKCTNYVVGRSKKLSVQFEMRGKRCLIFGSEQFLS
jgi:hypothetical protein